MSFINIVKPEQAEGEMKIAYDRFIEGAGQVPKPLEMFSVSPGLFKQRTDNIAYYGRTNLSFPLLTLIRYLSAVDCNHGACVAFNEDLAKRQGMTDEELAVIRESPEKGPLEGKENQLLAFVVQAVTKPDTITKGEFEKLKDLGWTDRDIFEAVNHGADMVSSSILMKAFQID